MEDLEKITFEQPLCGSALPADYSFLNAEEDEFGNFIQPADFFYTEPINHFTAPNEDELADFFASDDFFGEQPVAAENLYTEINDSGCSTSQNDTNSEFVDSSPALSPTCSDDSTESISSITNRVKVDNGPDTKSKKRLQNREAARRYRLKKKNTTTAVMEEEKILENENATLRQKIDRLEAKIAAVKDVLRHQYGFPEDSDIVLMQVA